MKPFIRYNVSVRGNAMTSRWPDPSLCPGHLRGSPLQWQFACHLETWKIWHLHSKKMEQVHVLINTLVLLMKTTHVVERRNLENFVFNSEYIKESSVLLQRRWYCPKIWKKCGFLIFTSKQLLSYNICLLKILVKKKLFSNNSQYSH